MGKRKKRKVKALLVEGGPRNGEIIEFSQNIPEFIRMDMGLNTYRVVGTKLKLQGKDRTVGDQDSSTE